MKLIIRFLILVFILGILTSSIFDFSKIEKSKGQTTTIYPQIPTAQVMYNYSLQSGEAAWLAQHYDLMIFDSGNYNLLDEIKNAGGKKIIWYQLWDTQGQSTSSSTYQSLLSWCNSHGVDIESMFLHYSENTTLTINGTNYSLPSYANANPKSQSRAYGYVWGSLRWVYNLGNANFQEWRAERVASSVNAPPPGETNLFDGVFADEAIDRKVARSGDSGVTGQTGGGILEYPEMTGSWKLNMWDSGFNQSQWYKDWTSMAQTVRTYLASQGLQNKITMINVGDSWGLEQAEQGAKACLRELHITPGNPHANLDSPNGGSLGLIKNQSAAQVSQSIYFNSPDSSFPTDPAWARMWALSTFYLTKSDYTYFSPQYDPSDPSNLHGGYTPNKWFGAIEYNIGQPTADYYTFASGTDPVGQPYKVYARQFQNALVLVRVYQDGSYNNFSNSTAATINLGASYNRLNVDGTVTPTAISSISLRNSEGAILIKQNLPALTLSKSADKTSVKSGDIITYTIQYSATSAANNAKIEDLIPTGTTYQSGGTYDSVNKKVYWNLGNLLTGATGNVTFQVRVQ